MPAPVGLCSVLPRLESLLRMSDSARVAVNDRKPPYFVGVDVGGTNIKMGILDDIGQSLVQDSIPTEEERGPVDAMRRVAERLRRMMQEVGLAPDQVAAVGLATPGTMDIARGMLLHPHNLPHWWDFEIQACLQQMCGKPVSFANDANAAAFGEFWVGSGSEYHSIVLFTLGTGVGGGIIIGDLSIDGENSHGSELGHTIIDYNNSARLCGCGQRGHLEAYASAKAVVQRTLEALETSPQSSLRQRQKQAGELTPLIVAEEAEAGDDLARHIVLETARYLGIGTVNVLHTVDPAAVIFGGAMNFGGHDSALGEEFLGRIRQEIRQRAFPTVAERIHVDFASLGGDAGYIGAAGIARVSYHKPVGG